MIFDFDTICEWGPRLTLALGDAVPNSLRDNIQRGPAEYIEDAFDTLLNGAESMRLIEVTRSWLRGQQVMGYHGSRLSEAELASVRAQGLWPLIPWERKERLQAALSRHHRWEEVKAGLDAALSEFGDGAFGRREGQAHLTISRGALLTAFNHYLVEGSEFDQAVAVELLGKEARALLQEGRSPILFCVAVPGERAIEISERRTPAGAMSGLVRHILQFWAYWLHDPALDPGTQHVDFGLVFHEIIPASWIIEATSIDEAELVRFYRR